MGLRFRAASSVLRIGRRLIANDVKPGRRSAPCRPDFEVLERRLTPSTYVWTAKGDGLTWNDPNNWQHLSPMTFTQVTGTPTPNSVIVFPSFSSLPKGSSKTIDFDFSYVNFPISTLGFWGHHTEF